MFSLGSKITVCYGKSITAGEVANMSGTELAEVLTDTLRRMQTKSRVENGKKPFEYWLHRRTTVVPG